MAKLTYYTNFQDLKANRVKKSQNSSDLLKESELKELVNLLSSHCSTKSHAMSRLSPKQAGNGR